MHLSIKSVVPFDRSRIGNSLGATAVPLVTASSAAIIAPRTSSRAGCARGTSSMRLTVAHSTTVMSCRSVANARAGSTRASASPPPSAPSSGSLKSLKRDRLKRSCVRRSLSRFRKTTSSSSSQLSTMRKKRSVSSNAPSRSPTPSRARCRSTDIIAELRASGGTLSPLSESSNLRRSEACTPRRERKGAPRQHHHEPRTHRNKASGTRVRMQVLIFSTARSAQQATRCTRPANHRTTLTSRCALIAAASRWTSEHQPKRPPLDQSPDPRRHPNCIYTAPRQPFTVTMRNYAAQAGGVPTI